ncbi:MAG: multicopper polyphenol oxidase [Desulfobacterales bacterium]|nr:MAG: multicopper polyphenol oxidase [Desulfobacterales bacterium]
MQRNRAGEDGPVWFTHPGLGRMPGVRHGFFTRIGGVSPPPFASLNISRGGGDDPACVRENRLRVQAAMGNDRLFFIRQVHGTGVAVIRKNDPVPEEAPEADAVITNRRNLNLVIQTADCQPVLLYDPKRRAAGAVHAGWRGSVADIAGVTVGEMKRVFGTDPADLAACIGPSLGPRRAEFRNWRTEIPARYHHCGNAENLFDFWAISQEQMEAAGVRAGRIFVSGLCTSCRTDLFFSYRGEHITGRMASVIALI